ncbi:NEW3 domain-containing protein [Oricola thermophila]|uniref:Alpha-galactosidase NEW3 domain-containing protein n=1 Tax=Oricola thermophila TaxID=2742145 RepID=A0A6N1VDZ2_9HYPH|nr:NEW3 domain-containing protein [Oricola thermophila]QKV17379.1 hypothetical protein HTY61_02305 [Oricola thermophila]
MNANTRLFMGALVACTLLANAPAHAQSDTAADGAPRPHGFWLTTPTPEFTAGAGKTITLPLDILNYTEAPQRARLELSGIPEGWEWSIRSGGREATAAMVAPGETGSMTLELTPPAGSAPDTYDLELVAEYGDGTAGLPISLTISEDAESGATLEPELPAIRGSVKSTFQYKMKLTNEGGEDALFNLAADVPPGFRTTFKRGYGSEEITGIPVKAGETENVTLEVKLDNSVEAGEYPIRVTTVAGDVEASTDLALEVTGSPELNFRGPQDRLSGTAVAGKESSFAFTIENTGSAPAQSVRFNSTAPSGWTVTFDPEEMPELAPGDSRDVNVTIKPTEKAIAGDYMVTLRTQADGTSESVRFRTTVETSTMFGLAGIGVIGAAVIVLAFAVMRYGRR